jgi:pyruvate/2-oxoglutarate/acetoin dehydrogenase E1 component
MSTSDLLNTAMLSLAAQPNTVFIGQNVSYPGTAMFESLSHIPPEQRIEFPVAEELQLGCSIGLAMQGILPISIYPRLDFLMRAMDQLVNHLDKIPLMSAGQWKPKVIVRTMVGNKFPMNAGPQHTQDHVAALRLMLTTVTVYKITRPEEIIPTYQLALAVPESVIVVEAIGC